jgi:hypothetical protein
VLDPRRATAADRARLAAALAALAPRPVEHVRRERGRADRAALDDAALALCPGGAALAAPMWDALLAAVALRDRWRLPSVDG